MKKREPTPAEAYYSDRDYLLPAKLYEQFVEKVYTLARETFGGRGVIDLPVDIHIIDRTRYEPHHGIPIPYRHKCKTPEELEERMANLQVSVSEVLSALSNEYKILRHTRNEVKRKKTKEKS